jgi:hypothetical protein
MHSTTWTLVGAGLVFVTFVVKDIFSEQLKELGDALSDAESVYTIHQDSDLLWIKLAALETQIATLRDKVESASTAGAETYVNRLHNANSNVRDLMSNAKIWFEQTSRLLERLPSPDESVLAARDEVVAEIANVENEVKAMKAPTGPVEEGPKRC